MSVMRLIDGTRAVLMGLAVVAATSALAQDVMSPKEINAAADSNLTETTRLSEGVNGLLKSAQKANDDDGVACIRKALQKVDPLMGVSRDARGKVMEYLAIPDVERALFELRKMDIVSAKVRQFSEEARNCVSSGGPQDGNTQVQTTSQAVADGDETKVLNEDDGIVGNDPNPTSPFE